MREFDLKIVSAEKKYFDGKSIYCSLTTRDGSMGIKAYHEPLMAVLKDNSEFIYRKPDGTDITLTVANSILTFENNSCIVVTS